MINKCVPLLLYGLEACISAICMPHHLTLKINRFFIKLFQYGRDNREIVKACQIFNTAKCFLARKCNRLTICI